MGVPAESTDTPKPVLELPKVEGVCNVKFTNGTESQFFYNPVTGHWLAAADGKLASPTTQVGFADRIAGENESASERTISSWTPVIPDAPAT